MKSFKESLAALSKAERVLSEDPSSHADKMIVAAKAAGFDPQPRQRVAALLSVLAAANGAKAKSAREDVEDSLGLLDAHGKWHPGGQAFANKWISAV